MTTFFFWMDLKRVLGDARRELFLAKQAVHYDDYATAVHYIKFVLRDVDKLSKYVERMNRYRKIAATLKPGQAAFLIPP